ncbi:hypothetical protein BHE74_00008986 [Ensete ventricosum]|nr:hypothetical protein BHE74_00008986 [Ensete ventricosum]
MRTLIQKKEKGGGEKIVMEEMMAKREEDDVVLPGFRFHPTDEELVGFYLRRKVEKKKTLRIDIIKEMDIYKHDPWNLLKEVQEQRKAEPGDRVRFLEGHRHRQDDPLLRRLHRPEEVAGVLPRERREGNQDRLDDARVPPPLRWQQHRRRHHKHAGSCEMCSLLRLLVCRILTPVRCVALQEIWTICRIFKRSISYRKQSSKWKASSTHKRAPADSSCVTSSFECDNGSDYRCCASSGHSCSQEHNQVHGWQCNSISQPPSLYSDTVQSPSTNEFFRDGDCWDELGRMMEFMADQSLPMSVDTARGMYHAY